MSASYTVVYDFGGFITPPPPRGTVAYRPGTKLPVAFKLTSSTGQPFAASVASTLSNKLSVTLSGQGITPVTAPCAWNSVLAFFQCNMTIPTLSRIGSADPCQLTASENVTGSGVPVPPYTNMPADANPEAVFFAKS